MTKLTTKRRNDLPNKEFSGPNRSYPIDTENRARNALSRVSQFGTESLKEKVREKVHKKYPDIG